MRKKETVLLTSPENFDKFFETGLVAAESVFEELIKNELLNRSFSVDVLNRIAVREKDECGTYHNADFLFSANGERLFVFELTLGGGLSFHRDVLDVGKKFDTFALFGGVGLEINYWENDLIEFAKSVLKALDSSKKGTFWTEEITKALQAFTYVFSFLKEVGYRKEVYVRVLYPFKEGLKGLFSVKENAEKEIEELYRLLKEKYAQLKQDVSPYEQESEYWGGKLLNLCGSPYEITVPEDRHIDTVREKVKQITTNAQTGKVYFLLHPAGSGKTAGVLKRFTEKIEKDTPVMLVLFAPRRKIVENKRTQIENLFGEKVEIIKDDKEFSFSSKELKGYVVVSREKGRLNNIKSRFLTALEKNDNKFFAIFTTTQAATNTVFGRNTVKNLYDMVRAFLKKYKNGEVIVAIDEIMGSEGGFFVVKDVADYLRDFRDNVVIFAMDANLLCGVVLDRLGEKILNTLTKERSVIPECLMRLKGEDILSTLNSSSDSMEKFLGWPVEVYGMPSFPTKEKVRLYFDYAFLDGFKKGDQEQQGRLIVDRLEKIGVKTYCYVQNKSLANLIKKFLEEKGYKVSLHTAMTSTGVPIEEADYVVSTSTMARGVDVPFNKALIVVPLFNIENQLAEAYQATSRIRQGEEVEDKEIYFLTIWNKKIVKAEFNSVNSWIYTMEKKKLAKKNEAYILMKAYKILSFLKKEMEAFISPKEGEVYYVPIPKIRPHVTNGTALSKITELMEVGRRINKNLTDRSFMFVIKSR